MKIVINTCYGGFGVTKPVFEELGLKWDGYGVLYNSSFGIVSNNEYAYRAYPPLIAAIEKIGAEESSGDYSDLVIKEIPDGAAWEIEEYEGLEKLRAPAIYY